MRHKEFTSDERKYWASVFVTISQITFGVFWATILLPVTIDSNRTSMIVLNLAASLIFWFCGWILTRSKKYGSYFTRYCC